MEDDCWLPHIRRPIAPLTANAKLTVGYGDVYPIPTAGKIIGMIITFLGVGMVAIPTGIISAGFVEQYQRFKEMDEQTGEVDFHFIKVQLNYNDDWVGMKIMELNLPSNVVVAVIQRGNSTIVPRGNVVLEEKDTLVLGAESAHDKAKIPAAITAKMTVTNGDIRTSRA